jgi:hypothetical protein
MAFSKITPKYHIQYISIAIIAWLIKSSTFITYSISPKALKRGASPQINPHLKFRLSKFLIRI